MKRKTHFNKTQKRKMRKRFAWVQYEIIENKNLTSSAKLVYMVLARFTDNETQECYPSIKKISDMTGLHQDTINNSIKQLEKYQLILVDRASGKVNYYQLNQPPTTRKKQPPEIKKDTSRNKDMLPPENKGTNNTNTNNTYKNNTNKILNLFYKINPVINYSNNTYRNCINDLIKRIGFDEVVSLTKYAISIQEEKYAPVINNPHQLKDKLASLMTFKERNKKQEVKKPFYQGNKMWYDKNKEKWFVVVDNNFNEFAGDEKDIEYKLEL